MKQRSRSLRTRTDISKSRMASSALMAAGFVPYSPILWSRLSCVPFTKPRIMRTSVRGELTRNSLSYLNSEVECRK